VRVTPLLEDCVIQEPGVVQLAAPVGKVQVVGAKRTILKAKIYPRNIIEMKEGKLTTSVLDSQGMTLKTKSATITV